MDTNAIIEIMLFLVVFGPLVWYFIHSVRSRERKAVRRLHTDLIKEKLDIIKTAIAMGYRDDELAGLDRRLEKLIGTEKSLDALDRSTQPQLSTEAELTTAELIQEVELLGESRQRPDKEAE